jgi:hypothetical protein
LVIVRKEGLTLLLLWILTFQGNMRLRKKFMSGFLKE